MTNDSVILVDEKDNVLGTMEKMAAHRAGELHRAFSVFIFNSKGQLLLQQRAFDKYHSAGKWSNTCCSHPRLDEQNIDAAKRRLYEEMGLLCELFPVFSFIYRAEFSNGLCEHEFDHVFFGTTDVLPMMNPKEVAAYKYANMEDIRDQLKQEPDQFTEWFKICFDRVVEHTLQK